MRPAAGGRDSVCAALFSSFSTQRAGRVAPSSHPSRLNMAGSQLLSVVILLVVCSVRVSGEVVNFADSVQFTVREECAGGGMQLVRVRKTGPIVPRTVATLVRGVWQPTEDYKHRIHHVSASSVKLSELDFNDDAFYEFTCNNDLIRTIQLTVIFPYDVRVSEGETARIPCHLPSEELQGKSAQFERDGELVLEQNRSSGQPEGRLSVSLDWVQTGDLSLTVEDAQLEDGGSYVCYTVDGNGEKTRGEPAAVKVTVQRNRPAPTDAPQQPTPGPDREQTGPGLIVSIILNVLLLTAAVTFCALWRVSVRRSRRAGGAETVPLEGRPDGVIS